MTDLSRIWLTRLLARSYHYQMRPPKLGRCSLPRNLCLNIQLHCTFTKEGLWGRGPSDVVNKLRLYFFFLKVSDVANQVLTLAAFAHESFSNPSSNLPPYNNSAYQQQGKVIWDGHLEMFKAARWFRLWTWGLAFRSTRWVRGLTGPVLSGIMTSRASMVGGESFTGYPILVMDEFVSGVYVVILVQTNWCSGLGKGATSLPRRGSW